MTPEKLCALAKEAMTHAYAPYSGYQVGAALLCADGTVYQGCNIENASYTPSVCAERTAFFKAVCDGHRDFVSIAVCGGKDGVITGEFVSALRRVPSGDAGILRRRFSHLHDYAGGLRSPHPGRDPALQLLRSETYARLTGMPWEEPLKKPGETWKMC